MIPQQLIAVVLVILVWLIALVGMKEQNLLIQLAVMLAPPLFLLMGNLPLWFVIAVGVNQSGLIFPGLPAGLEISHVFMFGFVALILAHNIITKRKATRIRYKSLPFLYFFVVIVFLTIAVRGFGLRALGGSKWGGMAYVRLMVAIGFLIASRTVLLTPRQWKTAIVIMVVCSFLPAVAQIIFMISNGTVWQQYYFIKVSAGTLLGSLEAARSSSGVVRYQMFAGASLAMLAPALVFMRFRGNRRVLVVFLVAVAIVLGGLSGFRSVLMRMVGTVGLFIVLGAGKKSLLRIMQVSAVGVLALIMMVIFARHLPLPIQRSLSWIPFAPVSMDVRLDAKVSTQWRFEVWDLAWDEVPDYLWVGKGFAIEPEVQESYSTMGGDALYSFLVHNYHSGPLSLLLDLGVLGFISATLFLVLSCIEVYRNRLRTTTDPFLHRYYLLALASYVYGVFAYYAVFGSASTTIPDLCVQFAILDGILSTSLVAENSPSGSMPENRLPMKKLPLSV